LGRKIDVFGPFHGIFIVESGVCKSRISDERNLKNYSYDCKSKMLKPLTGLFKLSFSSVLTVGSPLNVGNLKNPPA